MHMCIYIYIVIYANMYHGWMHGQLEDGMLVSNPTALQFQETKDVKRKIYLLFYFFYK